MRTCVYSFRNLITEERLTCNDSCCHSGYQAQKTNARCCLVGVIAHKNDVFISLQSIMANVIYLGVQYDPRYLRHAFVLLHRCIRILSNIQIFDIVSITYKVSVYRRTLLDTGQHIVRAAELALMQSSLH